MKSNLIIRFPYKKLSISHKTVMILNPVCACHDPETLLKCRPFQNGGSLQCFVMAGFPNKVMIRLQIFLHVESYVTNLHRGRPTWGKGQAQRTHLIHPVVLKSVLSGWMLRRQQVSLVP
jgi:hypothetical protein